MFSKTFRLGNDIDEGKTALRLNLGVRPSNIETAHAGKMYLEITTGEPEGQSRQPTCSFLGYRQRSPHTPGAILEQDPYFVPVMHEQRQYLSIEKFTEPGPRDDMLTAYPLSKAARKISVTEDAQLFNVSIWIYRLISVAEVTNYKQSSGSLCPCFPLDYTPPEVLETVVDYFRRLSCADIQLFKMLEKCLQG